MPKFDNEAVELAKIIAVYKTSKIRKALEAAMKITYDAEVDKLEKDNRAPET